MSKKTVIPYDSLTLNPDENPVLFLVGGDWNHGILNDFPETVGR